MNVTFAQKNIKVSQIKAIILYNLGYMREKM